MSYKLAIAGLLLVSAAMAQSDDLDKAFVEFQRVWAAADKNAAAKILSDDLVWISRRGRSLSRQEVLDTLSRRGGMENIRDRKVRLYGTAAVITFADGDGANTARRTVIWTKTPEGWKVVSFHASPVEQ
jgi:ketosteroid isomerase-like protein